MTPEEFSQIQQIITAKAKLLMAHEQKESSQIGFPSNNYLKIPSGSWNFYVVSTNTFQGIIFNDVLLDATRAYPEKFGTLKPGDVLKALYDIHPYTDFETFCTSLQKHTYCYIVGQHNGQFDDRVLRLDLFRSILPSRKGKYDEFVGGLFHANCHFSVNGVPLSIQPETNDMSSPDQIVTQICLAFFTKQGVVVGEKEYAASLDLSSKYQIRFSFFFETNIGVYFLKTAFKEEIQSKSKRNAEKIAAVIHKKQ